MKYLKSSEIAIKWGVSERSIRNYCNLGKIDGALLIGKTWHIPEDATPPQREPSRSLKKVLIDEKNARVFGGIYHKVQVMLTYNSNHIEGSTLTEEQTRHIYETNTIGLSDSAVNVDDVVETINHFRCVDLMLDAIDKPITEKLIKELHATLKIGTSDARKDWFRVGEYKVLPNTVGGLFTTAPEKVHTEISALIKEYNGTKRKTFDEILDFHYRFERIHPFQDGNGRVGRLILFKECLKNGIVPFVIDEQVKAFYYRGLAEWEKEKGYLRDTCLLQQDKFKLWLDYFRIRY